MVVFTEYASRHSKSVTVDENDHQMGKTLMLDRIIFGDNQFFGINHMSQEKAQALEERFRDLKAITDVIA